MTPQVSTCPECGEPMTLEWGPLSPGGPTGGTWWCANGHSRIERMRDDEGELMKKPPRGEVHVVQVPDTARVDLIAAIATMPEEAFGWLVLALLPQAMLHGAKAQIWPDGIGGFSKASKVSIEAARAAATAYLKQGG